MSSKMSMDDFEILNVVGKGRFAKVVQARKKDDGKVYAIKILRKELLAQCEQIEHIKTERSILQRLDHPFLVRLHYAFQTDTKLYLVLDFVRGGEIFYHLRTERRFSEERVRQYVAEILLALDYLHEMNVIYRDLKAENILLDQDGHIKLTDFGLSKQLVNEEGQTYTFCGSPEYLAPEVLRGDGHTKAVDFWSLGILAFEMLTGMPPFYSEDQVQMYDNIMKSKLLLPRQFSPELQQLLSGLLIRDPTSRLGSGPKGAKEVMEQAWFKSVDFDKLSKREVVAEFQPFVAGSVCVNNFDPEFTSESAIDSVVPDHHMNGRFDQFTYVAESAMTGK